MIAIIDYGVGNLFSLRSSFAAIGQEAAVTRDIGEIRRADRLKSCALPAWTGL